jgi:hypothetical protein
MRFAERVGERDCSVFSVLRVVYLKKICHKIASNSGGGWPSGYGEFLGRLVAHFHLMYRIGAVFRSNCLNRSGKPRYEFGYEVNVLTNGFSGFGKSLS